MSTKTVYRQLTPRRHTPRVSARRSVRTTSGFDQLLAKLGVASAMLQHSRPRRTR